MSVNPHLCSQRPRRVAEKDRSMNVMSNIITNVTIVAVMVATMFAANYGYLIQ
jgi:hypothetical protein